MFLFGCNTARELDSRFVGAWQSGLPISGNLSSGNTVFEKEIERQSNESQRQANASQSRFLRINILADGTFNMHYKMDHQPLKEMIELLALKEDDGTPVKIPAENLYFTGEWSSDSDTISLRSKSMMPFAHQEHVRRRIVWRRSRGRRSYVLRGWRMVLHLHDNNRLRPIRKGTYLMREDSVLDFIRLPEIM